MRKNSYERQPRAQIEGGFYYIKGVELKKGSVVISRPCSFSETAPAREADCCGPLFAGGVQHPYYLVSILCFAQIFILGSIG